MKFAIVCSGPIYVAPKDWIESAFLESYDPDFNRGEGKAVFTYDVRKAIMFDDLVKAHAYVDRVATNFPKTETGFSNRPIRCFKIEYRAIDIDAVKRRSGRLASILTERLEMIRHIDFEQDLNRS